MGSALPAVELPQFKGRPGWEFTDISALNLSAYEPARAEDADAAPATERLFALEQSQLPDGVIVAPIDSDHEILRRHRGTLIDASDDVFATLNANDIRVRSMRNESNRLEKLFVRLTGDNKKVLADAAKVSA